MIVSEWQRRYLAIEVKQAISVNVHDVASVAGSVVSKKMNSSTLLVFEKRYLNPDPVISRGPDLYWI